MAVLSKSKQLKKELTLFDVYAVATGATLSSGFFLLPGLAAAEAGPAVVFCYLLAIIPLIPGILSKIELATAMPRAGGVYYFIDRSLGPLCGTIGGVGTWGTLVLKTAFALIGIGAYLGLFFPNFPVLLVAAVLAVVFGLINLFGAQKSSAIQAMLVLCLLSLLIWFAAAGLPQVQANHFEGFAARGWRHFLAASGLVCISYVGITKVASISEEVKNPERNLPLGIFLAMLTALVVYGLGTFVMVGVLPAKDLNTSLTPVADAAEIFAGHTGAVVMTIAAVIAFMSVGNAGVLSASRYPLAMSRDHLLPSWFGRLNRRRTPQNAVLATVAVILVCILIFDPTKIAKLASAFQLLLFAFNCLAVIVMRESRIESYDPGFRCPWYPWLQFVGVIVPFVFIVVMGWLPILFSIGLIAVGALWYFYYAQARVVRGGAIYHLFARLGRHRFEGLDRELRGILKEKGLRDEDPYDEVITTASVIDRARGMSFDQLVVKASQHFAVHLPLSAEQIAERFLEGTRVGATPVSKGVALPHLRVPDLDRPLMVLGRLSSGVTVDADVKIRDEASGGAIYAVIFLVSPDDDAAQHLRILAQLAQRIDDQRFMAEWLSADSEQELKEILLREDRFLSLLLLPQSPTGVMIGQVLRELQLPPSSLVAMIHRAGEMIVPGGSTVLQTGRSTDHCGRPREHCPSERAISGGLDH